MPRWSEEQIEEFIRKLDEESRDMCVNPDHMKFECCDCYLCRVDFFNRVRDDLRKEE